MSNDPSTPTSSSTPANSLFNITASSESVVLPPPNLARYGLLPTPQSPNHVGPYIGPVPQTPESPLAHSSQQSSYLSLPRHAPSVPRKGVEDTPVRPPSRHTQIMTPESSPFFPRTMASHPPQFNSPDATPQASSRLEFSMMSATRSQTPPPSSPMSLSSPFRVVPKSASSSHNPTPALSPPPLHSMQVDDFFSPGINHPSAVAISTPPISPVNPIRESESSRLPGGEMDRIRMENMHAYQDLETRRPEYLVRSKRPLSEVEPSSASSVLDDGRDRFGSVGITDSPHKGRRIALFQETSEESFEESLMAGGYGRYRTAEWVRQPQPIALATPGSSGPSNIVAQLEEAEEPPKPPSEKELKKRKRLAAFKSNRENGTSSPTPTKLYPVELEGKGRVLLDIPNEIVSSEPSSVKKRGSTAAALGASAAAGNSRRKKKAEEKRVLAVTLLEEPADRPNWPDSEFPWRLRTEERAEIAKAEEEERMKWIEKFLERDTDDEDDAGPDSATREDGGDEEVLPSSKWGVIYEDEAPIPYRRGRGKMVPLQADPVQMEPMDMRRSNAYFPSDPADARAALLSKKSVRALSYRHQRKLRTDTDDEMVCICRGTDDGRELVQCDECKMWFHLQCLGIGSIHELGKEEDPWFCHDCSPTDFEMEGRASSSEPELVPTFVPTDNASPLPKRSFGEPFLQQSVDESPLVWGAVKGGIPKTPTRTRGYGPATPRHPVRVYTSSTPGPFDGYSVSHSYDDQFDPTSTPSRGITTPKNAAAWPSSRPAVNSFQTPLRPPGRGSRTFGGPGFLASTLDDGVYPKAYEDSPVRRGDFKPRRIFETPVRRSLGIAEQDMSPVARSRDRETIADAGHGLLRAI